MGRAQAPDITSGGVSGTISSSSLYQRKDVSFFTLATWRTNAVLCLNQRGKKRKRSDNKRKIKVTDWNVTLQASRTVQSSVTVKYRYSEKCGPETAEWNQVSLDDIQNGLALIASRVFIGYLASWCALSSGSPPPSEQLWTLTQKNTISARAFFKRSIATCSEQFAGPHRLRPGPGSSGFWPCRRGPGWCKCPRWLWWTDPPSSGWSLRPRRGSSCVPERKSHRYIKRSVMPYSTHNSLQYFYPPCSLKYERAQQEV